MRLHRREALVMGGGILAALWTFPARSEAVAEIAMAGDRTGAHVWFNPIGLLIQPGQTVRWTNRDAGNSHTATAYHNAFYDRPIRMPASAKPWDSGYLLPGDSFSITLTVPGVYDYYCVPHERAGMVGRIVVGTPPTSDWREDSASTEGLSEAALQAFPAVEEIMAKGVVER